MKKILFILSLLPCTLFAQNEVLSKFFDTIAKQTLQADFVITIASGASQPLNYSGEIIMRGECFYLTMGEMEIAYDGTTLYNYSDGLEELSLSTPTEEELASANPLLVAKALVESSEIKQSEQGSTYHFTLIPFNTQTGVESFTLTLKKESLLPQKIVMKENLKSTTTLQFIEPKYTNDTPSFVINKEGAYINDLR